jgi:hypothetical protein
VIGRRRLTVPLLFGSLVFVGVLIGLSLPDGARADVVGDSAALPPADTSFQQAQAAAPFQIKTPTQLPSGVSLFHVMWIGPTDEQGVQVFSVDLWYTTREGDRIHVWETNNPFLTQSGKDPTQVGDQLSINGRVWRQANALAGSRSALSRRFADGITVSMDRVAGRDLGEFAAAID